MAELATSRPPEPLTSAELAMTLDSVGVIGPARPVMLRVRGETFPCTTASLVFHEGRYVLMLDGESRG